MSQPMTCGESAKKAGGNPTSGRTAPSQLFDRIAADAVTLFHILWSIIIFGGAILMLFDPAYASLQIATMTTTVIANISLKGLCPFTILEEKLRQKIDPSYTNQGSFATTYLNKMFGTKFKVRNVNIVLGALYVLMYVTAFWFILQW